MMYPGCGCVMGGGGDDGYEIPAARAFSKGRGEKSMTTVCCCDRVCARARRNFVF